MVISPQLGQENFVASVPGAIVLWHDVHVGIVIVRLNDRHLELSSALYRMVPYISYYGFLKIAYGGS